jgi:hypothetical protein
MSVYDGIKARLGNLTLLEKISNIVIGNHDFYDVKRPVYEASGFYLTRSISKVDDIGVDNALTKLNKLIKSWDSWNDTTIGERQEMLFELSQTIWAIETLA